MNTQDKSFYLKQTEALKLALEALEYYQHRKIEWDYSDEVAITAIREALAEQPAQQQELEHDEHGPECSPEEFLLRGILASELKCWHRLTADEAQNLVAFVQNMPAKPSSKPCKVWDAEGYDALCQELEGWKAKASKPWVGLTNKDIYECEPKTDWYDSVEFALAIEAKLREKNA